MMMNRKFVAKFGEKLDGKFSGQLGETLRGQLGKPWRTRRLALYGLLVALTVIGANVKVMGSVAFDAAPAFLGTLLLGPVGGAVLGAVGHFVSAALAGFPFSVPVHLVVAVLMALTMYGYGRAFQRFHDLTAWSYGASGVVAWFINVPFSLAVLYPIMRETVWVLLLPLSLVCIANLIVAGLVYSHLSSSIKARFTR